MVVISLLAPTAILYIGLGDGGGGGDPQETGQNTTNLLGSMLRIDVLGVAYPSPATRSRRTTPSPQPEVRPNTNNATIARRSMPGGCAIRGAGASIEPTGQLWLGDVGQGAWEEVDIIERGGNYGWDCREGATISNRRAARPAV